MHCDVAVIGAGAAGISAAIAAAESGANVVLLERYGFTGGLATSALVGTICGLFYRSKLAPRYAVQGFARQFAQWIQQKSHTSPAAFSEGLHFLPYQPSVFHQQAVQQLLQAGVQLCLHSYVAAAEVDDGAIVELSIHTMGNRVSLTAKSVVDCSGNAQLSMLANISRIEQTEYQTGAFVFQVTGLPLVAQRALALNMIRWIKRGIHRGDLEPQCERLSIIPGTFSNGVALLKLGMGKRFDGSIACLSQYELEARSRSVKIVDYLCAHEPELKALTISAMATEVGVRTMSRSQGIKVLDEQQILSCAKPEDGVAIGAWPIELWLEASKPEMQYFALDDCYWIPAGTLVSRHLSNLFFAGRAISATERAIASARVIGTCLSTGYAAGMLATQTAEGGTWQSAIEKVQQKQVFGEEE